MSDCGIYQIEHLVSGKKYIGSAVRVARRFNKHKSDLRSGRHHSIKLQHAWNKYGEGAFAFSLVEATPADKLLEREQHWIDSGSAIARGYNVCPVAGSCRGRTLSPEHRAKLAAAQTGKKRPPEHFAAAVGVERSAETRARISAAKKGVPVRPDVVERRVGRVATPETRAKQSVSLIGKAHSFESRRRAWITRRANLEAAK